MYSTANWKTFNNLNLNFNKFILESTFDEIIDKLNSLEGSVLGEWNEEAKNILIKNGVSVVNEKSTNDLIKSLVGLRDKQKKRGQKIDPEVISALKHAFECKDLFLCLFDIRSKVLSNEIYRFLLMYKNRSKTFVDVNELQEYIDGKMKNFLEYAKEDFLNSMIENNEKDMLKIMVECGADVNKESITRETPLFYACGFGNLDLVKYLIEHGADVNKGNFLEVTFVFYVYVSGNESLVKYLVEHEVNVNKRDKYGKAPLDRGRLQKHKNVVNYLLTQGVVGRKSEEFSDDSEDE